MDSENELQYQQSLDLGLLIELVQGYNHLYDLSNKHYKDNNKKEESWKEISEIMGVSASRSLKRKADPDCAEMVEAAKRVADSISSRKSTAVKEPTQNEAFCQYNLSRLNSMDKDEAKQKRRRMLLIVEDLE
ncbi:unnamed protein product [Ceutorhynchus assimilis]|uniref:MADF domain-containing protein n=1 Tax=Ceutorhynchus assimilis TaxID=467358 RepID=A0A9N9MG29_9CUCU|nr:unnamed protein product [Ceutorhynchus assimilis]